MKHVPHDQQREKIVAAACELIEEFGVTGITMTLLARRARVSRVWLYEFFPDLESVYLAVFDLALGRHMVRDDDLHTAGDHLVDFYRYSMKRWWTMPIATAKVGMFGIYCANSATPLGQRLHARMLERSSTWVDRMAAGGVPREEALAATVALTATIYSLVIANHEGTITQQQAEATAHRVIDALIDPEWRLARAPRSAGPATSGDGLVLAAPTGLGGAAEESPDE